MAGRRYVLGGIAQETNSFTGMPTTMGDFVGRGGDLERGRTVIAANRGVNTVVGGFIDDLEASGAEIVGSLHGRACPGGPLDVHTYEKLRDELVHRVAGAAPFDGVLLALHGAMLADGYPDPEGDILEHLRARIGDIPVGVVLDLHANVSPGMVANANVVVTYKTYPHVDMAESGAKASRLLRSIVEEGASMHKAFAQLPLMLPSIAMRTIDPTSPMTRLENLAAQITADDPDVHEIGILAGFPYADTPFGRSSVVVLSGADPDHAERVAARMADALWSERQAFFRDTEPADEAVARAFDLAAAAERPVVLADVADNPGSGGTGDTTGLLRLVLERDPDRTFVGILYDPESVEQAFALGEGGAGAFAIGGKVNPQHGAPMQLSATVEKLSDGVYVCSGPMNHGKEEVLGRTALLRVGKVLVAVSEGRASVNDPEMLRMLGVEPSAMDLLVMKVKGHFRAAFGPLVGEVVDAESPGASMTDFTRLHFEHLPRPVFPLDPVVDWKNP